MSGDTQDLLDFGTVSVFYVVWHKHGHIYYMSDSSNDTNHMKWSRSRQDGIHFYTEGEASRYAQRARESGRPGVSIITADIDVVEEFDHREWP